jgi:hypothetical protein
MARDGAGLMRPYLTCEPVMVMTINSMEMGRPLDVWKDLYDL